ncbi:MAG: hypothetical protein KF752_19425 [Pirellulaceae bacterium]|nr:hypothetical protein [Pirellulaceae bacterium]
MAQQGDISVANVVGSNSLNIGIILGLTALVCPIPVHLKIIRVDAPICLAVAILLPWMLSDNTVFRPEGLMLLVGLVAYTGYCVLPSRTALTLDSVELAHPSLAKH